MRYVFISDDNGTLPTRIHDMVLRQDVIKLPPSVAEKTLLIYKTSIKKHGYALADEWMHGYVSGAVDTELILKGLVK